MSNRIAGILCSIIVLSLGVALGAEPTPRPNQTISDDSDPTAMCIIVDDSDPVDADDLKLCRDVNKVHALAKRMGWTRWSMIRKDGYLAFTGGDALRACDDDEDCAQSGPAFCADNKAGVYVDGSANVTVSFDPSDGSTISVCAVGCERDGTVRTGYQGCIGYAQEDEPNPETDPDDGDVAWSPESQDLTYGPDSQGWAGDGRYY